MYQNLVRSVNADAPESVHHCLYPQVDAAELDQRLLDKMRLAITTASLGRAARASADVKLRQPLATARVNVGSQQAENDLRELADVIAEEMNVKAIEIVSEVGELVNYKLLPNNRALGPKFGKLFPQIRKALEAVDPTAGARILQAGDPLTLDVNGQTVALTEDDVLVQTEAQGETAVASERGVTVAVDTHLTPELVQEGYARDLVRYVNNMRKEAGLEISDRIALWYTAVGEDPDVLAAFDNFGDYLRQEVLAESVSAVGAPDDAYSETVTIGDSEVMLSLRKNG